jgi:hypothetical protein
MPAAALASSKPPSPRFRNSRLGWPLNLAMVQNGWPSIVSHGKRLACSGSNSR